MKAGLAALLATAAWHPCSSVAQIVAVGPELPPAGRSLFDTLIGNRDGYDIPYPFENLIAQLRARAGCKPNTCARQVLIPLGRSLQRSAAIGEYFRYPRVVTAFDAESEPAIANLPLLRDRLYLGYQEKSNLIEVISYNEAAGRFEFQLVSDYTAGGKPSVRYAQRTLCASCHQGLSPIFSRPLWQETNANPDIAARVRRYPAGLHGVAAQVSIDEPNAIDNATERASRFAAMQAIWQTGCGDEAAPVARACRASLLTAALQYRLSAGHGYASSTFAAARNTITARWQTGWPQGLSLPNNDIPGRIPDLTYSDGAQARRASYIAVAFEPLVLRAPREVWREFGAAQQEGVVADLASFFARSDIQLLDRALRRAKHIARQRIVLECPTFELSQGVEQRIAFECRDAKDSYVSGRVYLNNKHASLIEAIRLNNNEQVSGDAFEGTAMLRLDRHSSSHAATFNVTREGLSLRSKGGQAVNNVELNWSTPGHAQLTLTIDNDFQALAEAITALQSDIDDDALSSRPFRRTAVVSALSRKLKRDAGVEWLSSCCGHDTTLPLPLSNGSTINSTSNRLIAGLQTWCASCHASGEQFPPSFLSGSDAQVAAKLKQCAPRLWQRLAMWQVPAHQRNKTPMPPAAALADIDNAQQQAIYRREFATLAELVQPLIDTSTTPTALHAQDGDAYESLPPCATAQRYSDTLRVNHAEDASR